jgi:hypothetical protein
VKSATPGVYFNTAGSGYFVMANCSEVAGSVTVQEPIRAWDVDQQKMAKLSKLQLPALSVRLFRLMQESTVVLDVRNAILLKSIASRADHVLVGGLFHHTIELVTTKRPRTVSAGTLGKPRKQANAWCSEISDLTTDLEELRIGF